jgi:hypothetical protein
VKSEGFFVNDLLVWRGKIVQFLELAKDLAMMPYHLLIAAALPAADR